ncbi:hypothetical protein E0Z10_g193 [Xylaria hypoxylon]|uniref:Transcription factor domain-containing protein n=1 Tax=Xylaria hypoxylon TaxID=37992 RepID=A0A4Z0ZHS5_9PEZI|nr:hypothetical protein E0Z10_g193 [Xylaria hypoxylon]
MDRELLCKYPATRPYARQEARLPGSDPVFSDGRAAAEISQSAIATETPATNEIMSCDDESLLPFWGNRELEQNDDNSIITPLTLNNPDWFLQGNVWTIHEYELEDFQPKIGASHWKGYVKCVKRWLYKWVTDNHCPLIHTHLYDRAGFPPCLQDAYATLTAYMGKTEKNEDVVMQLVEDKSNALLRQHGSLDTFPFVDSCEVSTSMTTIDTYGHLARVQALFIYQFIRLFDGDVRQRAQAEKLSVTLQEWRTQLWESAKVNDYLQDTIDDSDPSTTHPQSTYKPVAHLWRYWILAESIRRIWMVVNYTHTVYLIMRDSQASCPGSIVYTLRRSLWEATSAAEWLNLANNKDPLFMRSDPPKILFAKASPVEVDEFGLSIVSIMWDSDRIDSWFVKAPGTNLQALLHV